MKLFCPALLAVAAADFGVTRVRRNDNRSYDERQRSVEDCGSDCWTWSAAEEKCILYKDDQGKSHCFDIDCNHDEVVIKFESSLFKTDKDNIKDLIQPPELADKLTPDGGDGWQVTCKLGECGMTVACLDLKGPGDEEKEPYLVFNTPILAGKEDPHITYEGSELFLNPLQSLNVDFKCAYKAEVTVDSDDFSVNAWEIEDKVLHTGSLKDGFKIKMYKDEKTTIPLTGSTLIGTTVYANVEWEVSTLRNKVKFFIESCDIDFNSPFKNEDDGEWDFSSTSDKKKFPLIDDTCYSQTFSAAQTGDRKIVDTQTAFGFKTFISGRGAKQMRIQLQCCIKVCLPGTGDNECYSMIKKRDEDCPSGVLDYKAGKFIEQN